MHTLPARAVALTLVLAFLGSVPPPVGAQPEPDEAESAGEATSEDEARSELADAPVPETEAVRAKLEEARELEGIEDSARETAVRLFEQALEHLEAHREARQEAAEFDRLTSEASGTIESIREELSRSAEPVEVNPPSDAGVNKLEQSLAQASADLEAARQRAESLREEVSQREERREAIPDQIAQLRQQMEQLSDDLPASEPGEGEARIAHEARRAAVLAEYHSIGARVRALEAELESYNAREDLLPLRRDRARRRVQQAEQRVEAWRQAVNRAREAEAQRQRREAERLSREAARQHPVLKRFGEELEALISERSGDDGYVHRLASAQNAVSRVEDELRDLREQFISARRRIDASGLNRATGLLLRRHLQALPEPEDLRRRVRSVRGDLESVEFRLVELEELRQDASDIDRTVSGLMERIRAEGVVENQDRMEEVARELAQNRREALRQMVTDARSLFDALLRLDTIRREHLAATRAYESFIRERILWVRSIAGDGPPLTGTDATRATEWLLDPAGWRQASVRSARRALATPWTSAPLAVLAVVLFFGARACRRRVRHFAGLVSSFRTDALRHTIWTTMLTIASALPLPTLLWITGWFLATPVEQLQVAIAVGKALQSTALFLLPAMLLFEALRPEGLAEIHFRWPTDAIRKIRFHLKWFLPIVLPMVALTATAEHPDEGPASSVIGRVSFSVIMVALAVLIQRLLRPSGPVLAALLRWQRSEWIDRTRIFWYPALVLAPMVLLTLSWFGYHYTALTLAGRIEATVWLVLALVVLNGLLMRWLFVERRRVAIENARRRREQAAADQDKSTEALRTESSVAPIEESQLDLPAISAQSQQLFRTIIGVSTILGLYLIWASVLPALRALDRVEVWPDQRVVEADYTSVPDVLLADGAAATGAQATGAEAGADQTRPPAQTAPPAQTGGAQPGATPGEAGAGGGGGAGAPSPGAAFGQPTLATTNGGGADASGDAGAGAAPPPRVTLADLGLALVVLIATSIAFRNIPGLAEIFILQRLPLDPSGRYAITTVIRYLIAIFGVLIAFNVIGLTWSSVQWLAAALTFGLAFGLQEIFANFVSGLIILAERPIRLGDTVTVGGVSGTVTRIRMRATTIVDWDRKELVIPNKTFITGDVINWSLTDTILRLIVPVGVSYGSDVDKVESVLLDIAKKHKLVLDTPAPYVLFNRFGDSTLDFELRVFLTHLDYLLTVKHELHNTITKAFREQDIEIAFPQRDLHVRSTGPLGEALAQPTTRAEALTERSSAQPG